MDATVQKRLGEVCRHGNLLVPPETRSADPASLRMIYHLFDKAEEKKVTSSQGRALDILLIAYATMSRMGEIRRLSVGDVSTPTGEAEALRISFVQKQNRRKGTEIAKVAPAAVGKHSWCPRKILMAWTEDARRLGRTYVFGGELGAPPSVQAVDKAPATALSKPAPGYPLKITGHSARRGQP